MLKYGDATATIQVKRPAMMIGANGIGCTMETNIFELKTWKCDVITELIKATQCKENIQPGDNIYVTIQIQKRANLEEEKD